MLLRGRSQVHYSRASGNNFFVSPAKFWCEGVGKFGTFKWASLRPASGMVILYVSKDFQAGSEAKWCDSVASRIFSLPIPAKFWCVKVLKISGTFKSTSIHPASGMRTPYVSKDF